MGVNDGQIQGAFYVMPDSTGTVPGPNFGPNLSGNEIPRDLVEIVFLAEGYQSSELDYFVRKVRAFVNWIGTLPWFDVFAPTLGFTAIRVASTDTGIDDLRNGANIQRATFFDGRMGDWWQSDPNMLSYAANLVGSAASTFVPAWRAAVLLVNSDEGRANANPAGGTAVVNVGRPPTDGTFGTDPLGATPEYWMHVVLHELGHALFGLADEYDHFLGCNEDTDRDHPWPGWEPGEPNITCERRQSHLKWRHLVPDGVNVPTRTTDDCRDCPGYINPFGGDSGFPADTIGAFEGAAYFHCDLFRPAFRCRMRHSIDDFCLVCLEAMRGELAAQLPAGPRLTMEPKSLPVINACVGRSDAHVRTFRLANFGNAAANVQLRASHTAVRVTPVGTIHLSPGRIVSCTATLSTPSTTISDSSIVIEAVDTSTGSALTSVPGRIGVCPPSVQLSLRGAGRSGVSADHRELNLGRVVRGHTTMHRLVVTNLPSCCSNHFRAVLNIVSGPLFVAPGQANPIDLPPPTRNGAGNSADFWFGLSVAPSAALGPITGRLEMLYTPGGRHVIDVTAEAVDPTAFNVALAIDRSLSMGQQTVSNGPRRIEAVFEAVDLFLGLLRDADWVGLIRYNQDANSPGDVLVGLTQAGGTTNGRAAVRAVLNEDPANLRPRGQTSLGAGGQLAMDVLDGGSSPRRSFILLTDGEGNRPPAAVVPVREAVETGRGAYIIALEVDELSDELRDVSKLSPRTDVDGNETGPAAEILLTGPLVGQREFMLQKFYTQIVANQADEAFVRDPVHQLLPGERHVIDIAFGEVDYAATIAAVAHPVGHYPKYLEMSLESPGGSVFEHSDVETDPVGAISGRTSLPGAWKIFDVGLPALQGEGHVGTWRLTIRNQADTTTMRYAVLIKARSDLKLAGWLEQDDHRPGLPIEVVLRPTLFDRPVTLDTPVVVRVERPDGTVDALALVRTDAGLYRGRYRNTLAEGIYLVAAEVSVTTPTATRLDRARYMTGFIAKPKPRKGRHPARRALRPLQSWKRLSVDDWLRLRRRPR